MGSCWKGSSLRGRGLSLGRWLEGGGSGKPYNSWKVIGEGRRWGLSRGACRRHVPPLLIRRQGSGEASHPLRPSPVPRWRLPPLLRLGKVSQFIPEVHPVVPLLSPWEEDVGGELRTHTSGLPLQVRTACGGEVRGWKIVLKERLGIQSGWLQ